MSEAEFDRHAGHYRAVHAANITASGYRPEYFADYKMRDFARLVIDAGLPATGDYLDFGSGIGTSIAPFRAHLPDAHLTCADVSEESLAMAQHEHPDAARYVPLHEGRIPIADRSIDGAFACCVFYHIAPSDHAGALAELRRVLKPGGLLMVYEHNPLNPLTVRAVNTCPLDENAILIRARTLRPRCSAAGFAQARVDYRVFVPAGLKALRPAADWLRRLPFGAQYFIAARA